MADVMPQTPNVLGTIENVKNLIVRRCRSKQRLPSNTRIDAESRTHLPGILGVKRKEPLTLV